MRTDTIIIPRSKPTIDKKQYPFWGKPITYINPTEPAAESDWEVYK